MRFASVIVFLLSLFVILPVHGEDKSLTKDREIKTIRLDSKRVQDKLKAGVALGYPSGVTAGYRFSNFFELNGTIGTDFNDVTAGINGLFTLFNLEVSEEIFPVSFGPAVNTHFGHYDKRGRDDGFASVDLLGVLRIEYSFDEIPLNLFVEAGLGLRIIKFADDAGCFALGVRYIF